MLANITVKDPAVNAITSVTEVTVIETPECFKVIPIRSSSGIAFLVLNVVLSRFFHVWVITNLENKEYSQKPITANISLLDLHTCHQFLSLKSAVVGLSSKS